MLNSNFLAAFSTLSGIPKSKLLVTFEPDARRNVPTRVTIDATTLLPSYIDQLMTQTGPNGFATLFKALLSAAGLEIPLPIVSLRGVATDTTSDDALYDVTQTVRCIDACDPLFTNATALLAFTQVICATLQPLDCSGIVVSIPIKDEEITYSVQVNNETAAAQIQVLMQNSVYLPAAFAATSVFQGHALQFADASLGCTNKNSDCDSQPLLGKQFVYSASAIGGVLAVVSGVLIVQKTRPKLF